MILVLVAGVIWLLTTLVVRPVTRMATTATRIAGGELQRDVDAPAGSLETAELAQLSTSCWCDSAPRSTTVRRAA